MRRLRNVRAAYALLSTLLASRGPTAATVPASLEVVGDWQGTIEIGNGSFRIVFHLTYDNGSLTGTMDSPDQSATGIVVGSVSYNQPDVHLAIEQFGIRYEGKLDNDKGRIVGFFKQGPTSLPLTLGRIG